MFLINAPAGSGKTTYIENTIIDLLVKYPNRKILSITYTNRAKEELQLRINNKNVIIDTIHSFLTGFISLYLSKAEVIDLYFQIFKEKIDSLIDKGESEKKNARYVEKYGGLSFEIIKKNIQKISYNEQAFSSYYYGGLSHDDILYFCRMLFDKFPILKKRLSNKYAYIFIDEYQDTSADVLYIFYESLLNTNSKLYLLGDKMQEIYKNYDGSFNDKLEIFNNPNELNTNFRSSAAIVNILNKLYNDSRFDQRSNNNDKNSIAKILLSDSEVIDQNESYLQLYLFNSERFEKIGTKDLYDVLSRMKAYRFPSKYSPVDVLTDKTNDNPDKLFRIMFCICEFISLVDKKAYGQSIQFARSKPSIFSQSLTNIKFHDDKIVFSEKIRYLNEQYKSTTITILEFCNFLTDNNYCEKDVFLQFIEDDEYHLLLNVPLSQIAVLYSYLDSPKISTQHGVKGEGHDKVCFICEDSSREPVTYMFDFLKLFCSKSINLTDFQNYYYSYIQDLKTVDLSYLTPASEFKMHKETYLEQAEKINKKYEGNPYFDFCHKENYSKFISNPTSGNAKSCFKSTKIQGVLWSYKLFYVGCSRAKKELIVIVDKNRIEPFKELFINKMSSIGFEIE